MGGKMSRRRHSHEVTLEQDAAIGGTGGAMAGMVSGVGLVLTNALGLRASITILGLCVVGGTVVGALVCVSGAIVIK